MPHAQTPVMRKFHDHPAVTPLSSLALLLLVPGCALLVDAVADEHGAGGGDTSTAIAGSAGAPSGTAVGAGCTATGAEICSNGEDDDCNGVADCADPACGGSCEDEPDGAILVREVAGPGACPAGWTEHSYGECSGCACQPGDPGTCVFAVDVFATPDCRGAPLATVTSSGSACVVLSAPVTSSGTNLGAEVLTVGAGDGLCVPSAPTTPAAARTFCEPPAGATGCGPLTCMPAATGPTCALFAGDVDCPSDYPVRRRLSAEGATTCDCDCTSVDQICPEGKHVHAHPDQACDESKEDVDADKGCRNTKLGTIAGIEQHDEPLSALSTGCASTAVPAGSSSDTLCCSAPP